MVRDSSLLMQAEAFSNLNVFVVFAMFAVDRPQRGGVCVCVGGGHCVIFICVVLLCGDKFFKKRSCFPA